MGSFEVHMSLLDFEVCMSLHNFSTLVLNIVNYIQSTP